ncbi:MAG: phenylalanine--tRNA ligase subunit alpha [marine benthic group bacterium]|nr:phenylalanine--tRNA ligase subunit alpha [Candidatus Benthicola marisminoris]
MKETLESIRREALEAIQEADDSEELEKARVRFLGRNGLLSRALSGLRNVAPEERPEAGKTANEVKQTLETTLELRVDQLAALAEPDEVPKADLTLPGRRQWRGGVHPVTRVIDEICEIFKELGFTRAAGPEVETDWHNFTALNIPLDHPAADMHDTFYLDEGVLLRTHTSPVQARVMMQHEPPVRILAPGMVFRRDPYDASHAPAFEQVEGLAVDEGIDFIEFRAAIDYFVHRFFGPATRTRFRPSYFPFTEPSAEVDVSCIICEGSGCGVCKRTGWIEIMGSGMVNPAVFEAVGYDPERYTGYAFGMGPARIAMLRYRVPDIRLLYEADVGFLEQFA